MANDIVIFSNSLSMLRIRSILRCKSIPRHSSYFSCNKHVAAVIRHEKKKNDRICSQIESNASQTALCCIQRCFLSSAEPAGTNGPFFFPKYFACKTTRRVSRIWMKESAGKWFHSSEISIAFFLWNALNIFAVT